MSERTEPLFIASEKEMLCGWLDFHRATILRKIDGLSDEVLRTPMVPSGTSLLGMVKHLAFAEDYWFAQIFMGEDPVLDRTEPGQAIRLEENTADVIALYETSCRRSREIVETADLNDHGRGLATNRRAAAPEFTLRWILTRMIEETARHNGHADILREQIDGSTGA